MRRVAALVAGCLLSLQVSATDTPVRDWPSPGLELSAGPGAITLRGHIASTSHLYELNESAGPQGLTTAGTYKHIVLPEHWRKTSALLVTILAGMHSGDAAMTRDEVTIRGTLTETGTSESIESRLRESVPPETTVTVDIWQAPTSASACGALFGVLLEKSFRLRAGETSVSGEHFPRLNRIADALDRCRMIRLRITGHTDNTGDVTDNELISEQRAKAYADYLAGQGIAEKRLVFEGRGSAEPVANNRSAAGRNRNRRVAIEIY